MVVDFIDLQVADVKEAQALGAQKLGVPVEQVEVEVLEEAKKGLFGKKSLRVRVYKKAIEEKQESKEEEAEKPEKEEKEGKLLAEVSGDFGIYFFYEGSLACLIPRPVAGEPPVEYLQVVEEVTKKGFVDVDLDALALAVETPGVKVKIGPAQPKHLLSATRFKVEEEKKLLSFDFRPDGLYALPVAKGEPLDLTALLQQLQEYKIQNVDEQQLLKIVEGAQDFVRIAPPQPEGVVRDGRCEITVTADEMKATVKIYPPFGGKALTAEDILRTLKDHNIAIPLGEDILAEFVETGKTHPCATDIVGYPPVPGEDARLEFLFSEKETKTGPKELEDGRVDYKSLGTVRNVRKGDVLVIKHPAGMGAPGMTVTGKEIPPLPGKDIPLLGGKGTEVSEDGLRLLASLDGQPVMQGNKVAVLPVFEVPHDVDLSTGNIDFVGNVVVRGGVLSGFCVKAEGDVEVFGNVEDAEIIAKGNIKIRGGVYGHGKALVRALGDIAVRFGENATFIASGDVKVGEALMHCQVSCGKKVDVGGKKGLIVGGVIRAGDAVSARTIGNRFATPTVIEVGIDPQLREELLEVRKKVEQEQTNLQKTQKALETLKALQKASGSLPPDKQELVLKLTRTQFQLMAQIKQLVIRKQELEELTRKKVGGKISASDTIFSGVSIAIGDVSMAIRDELKYVTLTEKDGQIKQRAYTE